MWLAAAAPSLARRLLFLGPPPPPLLLLLLSRSSRRRRRLHSLGLAAMPEKRPFERLPADVSPINYSLCLKPDLLDFTFEGKLEAAAQVRRPLGAEGELRGKQLGRGLGWGPGRRAGGPAGLGAEGLGLARPARGPARPFGAAAGRPGRCALPCWAGARAALRGAPREQAGPARGPPRSPPGSTPVRGVPSPTPGPSGLGSVLGEAGGCWGRPEGSSESTLCLNLLTQFFSLVLSTPHGGHIGRGRSSGTPAAAR